jgi:hypothetical protein
VDEADGAEAAGKARVKFTPGQLIPPVLGVLTLAIVLNVTLGAINTSGAWKRTTTRRAATASPYLRLSRILASAAPAPVPERDPFTLVSAAAPTTPRTNTPRVVRVPPPPPRPVLTSIVWDADPRATLRYGGRDYSVRTNTLFSDFRVLSITRDQVVLERGGEQITLRLSLKGEDTP